MGDHEHRRGHKYLQVDNDESRPAVARLVAAPQRIFPEDLEATSEAHNQVCNVFARGEMEREVIPSGMLARVLNSEMGMRLRHAGEQLCSRCFHVHSKPLCSWAKKDYRHLRKGQFRNAFALQRS